MAERYLLAIRERGAARVAHGAPMAAAVALSFDDDSAAAQASVFEELLKDARQTEVVLDDRLVRHFVVTPPAETASLAELRSVAAVRLAELFGVDPEECVLAANWQSRRPFLCCALSRPLGQALVDAARKRRARLVSIAPLFVRVCNTERAAAQYDGWLAVRAAGWVTAANLGRDTCRQVRSCALEGERALLPWLSQLALTTGLALGRPLLLDSAPSASVSTTGLEDAIRLGAERRDVQLLDALAVAEAL